MRDLPDNERLAQAQRQQDFDDLQNEIAGRDTGRIARFLSADDPRSVESKRKKREQQAEDDQRFIELMKDPEYNALYTELGTRLRDAEQQTDAAIQAAQSELAALRAQIDDMEAAAAKNPNGNPVFRTKDGRVVDTNGEELPIEIAAGIVWPENAPSAEDYFAATARHDALADHLNDLHGYRTDVLGGMRDRYDDTEDPMEKDDLKQALDDIEALRPELKTATMPEPAASPNVPVATSAISIPTALN